ncbi:MAG: hypothetical protein QXG05_08155 [Nitrososphaerota archaeon]
MQLKSILVMAILLVGVMPLAFPVLSITGTSAAFAASGNPKIGALSTTYPYKFTSASFNVSVPAGTDTVVNVDKASPPVTGLFDINFTGVTFTGGQFFLYVSKNGLSQLSSSDVNYSGPFPVAQLQTIVHTAGQGPLHGWFNVTVSNPNLPGGKAKFSLGNDSIVGPAPTNIAGGSYYIKVFDGSSTSVAVSIAQLVLLPGITISPTSGPAGATVTVSGSAFSPSSLANVTVSSGQTSNMPSGTIYISKNVSTSATGAFTFTFKAPDLDLSFPNTGTLHVTSEDYATSFWVMPQTFTELARYVNFTYFTPSGFGTLNFQPNATAYIPGYVTEPIVVVGANFNPSGSLSFTFNGSALSPSYTTALNTTTGFFNATFNVPVSPHGVALVIIQDASAKYVFKVGVLPTLIMPTSVNPGQKFTITGYAFTASSTVNITWNGLGVGLSNTTQIAMNAGVGSNGKFTVPVTTPSPVYGGDHVVNATDASGVPGYSVVFVNATASVSPTTAALGTPVTVTSEGLPAGEESVSVQTQTTSGNYTSPGFTIATSSITEGSSPAGVDVVYDNALTSYLFVFPSEYGQLMIGLTATGYPQMHFIQLYDGSSTPPSLLTTVGLNVTGSTNEGRQILNAINSLSIQQTNMLNQLNALSSSVSSLNTSVSKGFSSVQSSISSLSSSVSSGFSSISSTLGTVQGSISSLSSSVSSGFSSISSSLSTISSTLGSLSSSVSSGFSSISSSLSTISSTLGSLSSSVSSGFSSISSTLGSLSSSVSSGFSSISSSLSTISSTLGTVQSNTASIGSLLSSVSNVTTYLLVAIVLAAIVLILEIVILVRKK